jgi:hypothetical protein
MHCELYDSFYYLASTKKSSKQSHGYSFVVFHFVKLIKSGSNNTNTQATTKMNEPDMDTKDNVPKVLNLETCIIIHRRALGYFFSYLNYLLFNYFSSDHRHD